MINRRVAATPTSPITQVRTWLHNRVAKPGEPSLIDVSQAAPGYPPATQLQQHIASLNLFDHSRYGPVLGRPELRDALATNMSRAYNSPIAPSNVAITAGANQAFCLAVATLCQEGDQVIIPVPYYFNHDMWLRISGVEPVYLPCGNDMVPDPDQAAALITDRTRAILLVTPNNPTGCIYPPHVIAEFGRLAAKRGIYLIMDETYRDFRLSTDPPHALFAQAEWVKHLIHIYSFSKVFSITGLRVGALAASSDLLIEVDKVADCLTICPNLLGQEAALFSLQHLDEWVDSNRLLLNKRLRLFVDAVRPEPYQIVSAGAFFAYLRHPFNGQAASEVAKRLFEDQSVLSLSGDMFGPNQDPFLRLSFGNLNEQQIPELVRRLAQSAVPLADSITP